MKNLAKKNEKSVTPVNFFSLLPTVAYKNKKKIFINKYNNRN